MEIRRRRAGHLGETWRGGLVVSGAAVVALSLTVSGGPASAAADTASRAFLRRQVKVGAEPLNVIASGPSRLWTENYGDGTVSVVDARAERRLRTVRVGGTPGGVAYGAGAIWVSDLSSGRLTRLSQRGKITGRAQVASAGAGVAVRRGVVFVADYSGGLVRVDARTMKRLGRTALPGQPEAVAVGFGSVWVSNGNGTINTVNPSSGAIVGRAIQVGADVDDVTTTSNAVWAVSLYGQRLVRINPRTRRITRSIRLRGEGSGLLVRQGSAWVANYDLGTVSRFSARTGSLERSYKVGSEPRGLAVAAGSVWVANQGSDSVSRVAHG